MKFRRFQRQAGPARKNGELLELAQGRFDLFLTVDQNLQFQQNLLESKIAILLLIVPDNSIDSILPLLPRIESALASVRPGEFRIIE
jgi:hypothetical protein